MRKHFLLLIFLMASCAFLLAQNGDDALKGKWTNPEEGMVIEFYQENELWHAEIVAVEDSLDRYGEAKRDIYNSDASKRSRKIIGIDYVSEIKEKSNGKWSGGSLYNHKNGNSYNVIMQMDEDGKLYIKGYWSYFRFLGTTTVWEKIDQEK